MNRSHLHLALLPVLAVLAACGAGGGTGPSLSSDDNPDDAIFLVRESHPHVYMDALYQGPITRDAEGCLRQGGPERATVVWPVGYTLTARDGGLFVEDADGEVVGQVGGAFTLGGGMASVIDHADGLSARQKALAASKCPGPYWLAGV